MSFISTTDLQDFQKNLENGDLKSPVSSGNPALFLQVDWRRGGAEKFEEAVESYNGRLEPLKERYPAAVEYLAYNPKSAEILSMVARYYFFSGSQLPAEKLALKAVASDPFDITARNGAVFCQALHTDQRERLMAGTWEVIELQKQWLDYFLKAKGREKIYICLAEILSRFLPPKQDRPDWGNLISLFRAKNEERLEFLKKEEDWLKYQYAFGLFLTDPLRWKEDARDCLDDEAVKADPLNLEHQCVVNAWVAEWMEDPALIQVSLKRLSEVKLSDPVAEKRLQDFTTLFESVKGYDKQQDALKVYDCQHPEDAVWSRLESDALQLPEGFKPPDPEPEGGSDYRDWLNKIATGEQSPAPGRTREDYTYPQYAEVKKTIDETLKTTNTMPVCPILLPLKDEQGRYNPLGAYLSVQAMTLACFPGKQILSFWAPYSIYESWHLFGRSENPHPYLLQELKATTGADSYAEGTLLNRDGGWEVSLNFKGNSKTTSYSKFFKKSQLHLIPGWMAESLHSWLGIRLSKEQKARLRKPIFSDDGALQHGLVLENFGIGVEQRVPGWNSIARKNPKSPFIIFRDYYTQKNIEGVENLKPMEALIKKDSKDDLARYFMAYLYINANMYGKSLRLAFDLLAKDQGNPSLYSEIATDLESLGDYTNARYLYEKLAARAPTNGQVQEALGQFYVDYAWVARGGGWGSTVSPWNAFLFQKRLDLAQKTLEKAKGLNPPDSRIYSDLIEVGKGQDWEKAELDKVFNEGISIDPDYYSIYSERMNTTMEKWGGSNEEMMAFAHKWQSRQPWLVAVALEEEAARQTDGKELNVNRYLGSPKVWPELNGAYQDFFKFVSKEDFHTWTLYAWDAARADKVQDFLSYLRAQADHDEEVRYFTPYLVDLVYNYRASVLGWNHAGQLYLNFKEVWPEIHNATLQVMKQDPDNYTFLDGQALIFTGWGRFKSARKVFDVVGDHWVPKIGTKQHFENFKRVAYGKEAPSWHLCLSTADQADER